LWTKGKEYLVINKRANGNIVLFLLKDDNGKIHWMRPGENFIIEE
jgi:hypothetical protein